MKEITFVTFCNTIFQQLLVQLLPKGHNKDFRVLDPQIICLYFLSYHHSALQWLSGSGHTNDGLVALFIHDMLVHINVSSPTFYKHVSVKNRGEV